MSSTAPQLVLTRREVEVALLVAEGLTSREIAGRLFISERTAEYHVEQIRNKLGFTSRAQIAAWAIAQDLRHLEPPPARRSPRPAAAPPLPQSPPEPAPRERERLLPRPRVLLLAAGGVMTSVALAAAGFLVFTPGSGSASGRIQTIAGSSQVGGFLSGYSGDFGPASQAQLSGPTGIAVAPNGDVYVAEGPNGVIRRIDSGGTITTVAGGGSRPPSPGVLATSVALGFPDAVATRADGEVLFTTVNAASGQVFVLRRDSTLMPLGSFGDPAGIAAAADGTTYVSDDGTNVVWRVDASGQRSVLAGSGEAGYSGDGGAARAATLNQPHGLELQGGQRLYVADSANNCVRVVDLVTGVITTAAGVCGSVSGDAGDGGPAVSARLNLPSDVAIATDGTLYISDTGNNRVRAVREGTIETIAGTGQAGFGGDGGAAAKALLDSPAGIAYDQRFGLFIADTLNARVRKVTLR